MRMMMMMMMMMMKLMIVASITIRFPSRVQPRCSQTQLQSWNVSPGMSLPTKEPTPRLAVLSQYFKPERKDAQTEHSPPCTRNTGNPKIHAYMKAS